MASSCVEGHRKKAKYLLDDDELGPSLYSQFVLHSDHVTFIEQLKSKSGEKNADQPLPAIPTGKSPHISCPIFAHMPPQPNLFTQTIPSSTCPLTPTFLLAQRLQTWSTPSFPLSSETQVLLILLQVLLHPLHSPTYSQLCPTRPGLQSSPPTSHPIPFRNPHTCLYQNRPLLPPHNPHPQLPSSPTLQHSSHVLPMTALQNSHIRRLIHMPNLLPLPRRHFHAIPVMSPAQHQ